jgi:hypothetical protein
MARFILEGTRDNRKVEFTAVAIFKPSPKYENKREKKRTLSSLERPALRCCFDS